MYDKFLDVIKNKYAIVIGRYVAVLFVGVIVAALNKLHITLSAADVASLTAGLTAVVVALVTWALTQTKKDIDNAAVVKAVSNSAAVGEPVQTEMPNGSVHMVSSVEIAPPVKKA